MRRRRPPLPPTAWGLSASTAGELEVQGVSCRALADAYGTPLHVVNEPRLVSTALAFRRAFESAYPGAVSVHYAMKCNAVPAVVAAVRRAGLRAEVMTPFELELACRVGYRGDELVVNGPCKPPAFLQACVRARVRWIVVDGLEELDDLEQVARAEGVRTSVLLRVNPDYVPRGMNAGSATGSRRGCAFGLDLDGGQVEEALRRLASLPHLFFEGYHLHVGTGIYDPEDYPRALRCLDRLYAAATAARQQVEVLDVGGGFAAPTTRELTAAEMILAQVLRRSPRLGRHEAPGPEVFAAHIAEAVVRHARSNGARLPTLLVEPGRSIASSNQLLLLRVHRVKRRPGVGTFVVTDGGLGTVTMPTYYEVHEVLLADDVRRPATEVSTVIGPVCFAGDVVVRHKRMPKVEPGALLAVMDSGAYFTSLESSFGFPRVAIAATARGRHRLIRRRETYDDMLRRDELTAATAGTPDSSSALPLRRKEA